MPGRSWRAPAGQGVTFVELFFDLVFVFAVTGVTQLLAHDLTLTGAVHAAIVFWLVWWAWTQLTWALNGADTTYVWLRAGTLAATVVAFAMAISIGGACAPGGGLAFAAPYVAVRALGLAIYARVAAGDAAFSHAVRLFGGASALGLAAALLGGLAPPEERAYWWAASICLELVAAGIGGREPSWNLYAPHFAERHGLFVIIALGESLLAAAVPGVGAARTAPLALVLVLSVGLVCVLWWTYFGWFQGALEHHLKAFVGRNDARFARDAYSFLHIPLVGGIVAVAVGIEEAVAHPTSPLPDEVVTAFAAGLVLFLAPTVSMWARAGGTLLRVRTMAVLALPAALFLVHNQAPAVVLAAAVAVLLAMVAVEARRSPAG